MNDITTEKLRPLAEWKDVVGYEGVYRVSADGQVRSLDRIDSVGRQRKGIKLRITLDHDGYARVTLSRNAQVKCRSVHTMMLAAFVGPQPAGAQGCHKDGNYQNNMIENLLWRKRDYNAMRVRGFTVAEHRRKHAEIRDQGVFL
jgi:hypothetical protein